MPAFKGSARCPQPAGPPGCRSGGGYGTRVAGRLGTAGWQARTSSRACGHFTSQQAAQPSSCPCRSKPSKWTSSQAQKQHPTLRSPPQLPNVVTAEPALEQQRHGCGGLPHKAVQRGGGQAQKAHALLKNRLQSAGVGGLGGWERT